MDKRDLIAFLGLLLSSGILISVMVQADVFTRMFYSVIIFLIALSFIFVMAILLWPETEIIGVN